jgi:D-alanyl-D-alanine carboxypeptidase (penicillin-binding protein 5/6)
MAVLAAPAFAAGAESSDPFPQPAAAYLVAVDGRTLWSRQPARPLPPASLTKIMTALLVLERTVPEDRVIVRPAAVRESGSRLGLRPGEVMTAGDLLAAMLLASANDACHALADHIAGSEARFVALMNRRAAELGLASTRFRNACGHDQPGHRSSARDLAVLARTAMADATFAALAATVRTTVATTAGRRFALENKNELIGRYPGAIGVKTGFTAKAGKCVVAAVEREGRGALLVLLNAPDRWWTAVAMLDRAFAVATAAQAPDAR